MNRHELIAELRKNVNELESIQRQLKERGVPAYSPAALDFKDFQTGAPAVLKLAKDITALSDDEIKASDKTLGDRNDQVAYVIKTGQRVLQALGEKESPAEERGVQPKLEEFQKEEPPAGDDVEDELQAVIDELCGELQLLCELEEPSDDLAEEIAQIRDTVNKSVTSWRRLVSLTRQTQAEDRPAMVRRAREAISRGRRYSARMIELQAKYVPTPARGVVPTPPIAPGPDPQPVVMRRAESRRTTDQPLWSAIRNRTLAMGFNPYKVFIDEVMCHEGFPEEKEQKRKDLELRLPFLRADAYTRLKVATELFMMQECGICIQDRQRWDFVERAEATEPFDNKLAIDRKRLFDPVEEADRLGRPVSEVTRQKLMDALRDEYLIKLGKDTNVLPYFAIIRDKLRELPLKGPNVVPPNCYGILKDQLTGPCLIELIWSFWHEAGFMVRTMQVVNRRFQNMRGGDRDPLTRFDLDTLRPLGNLLWGHIADEQHRLTTQRRVYEYDHHYGLRLQHRPEVISPVDSRSKFIAAFHNLLYLTSVFYKEDDDTTVIADAFRVLNALREVHLLLAEGAHNQFGDLPWTARAEMLMEQWLLARPEMREFLGGKVAVPYPEPWMDRVDVMKTLQGWTDVSIAHFHDLAVHGEQILLSVRYGNWSVVNFGPQAANWARYWRPEIQRYIHAYQAVTGVDLAIEPVDTTSPAELLRQRATAPR